MFFIPITLSILLQVFCAVHAVKNGRAQYWLWIILFFSVVGCLVYLIVEVLPDMWHSVDTVRSSVKNVVVPHHEISRLQGELDLCDSLTNRLALAEAYLDKKRYYDAVQTVEPALGGINKDDIGLLRCAAHAYFGHDNLPKAKECLLKIRSAAAKFADQEDHLMLAIVLQKMGETEAALKEYAELSLGYTGEEARCRYALFLQDLGRIEEAQKLFAQTVRNCKISPPFYRREHRQWLATATKEIESRQKKSNIMGGMKK